VSLSIAGLIANSYIQGGDAYLQRLSKTFLFGGDPSIMTYSISLLLKDCVRSDNFIYATALLGQPPQE
jgi:hypothetical protein